MVELSEAQVHLALTDDGQMVLDGLGEDTEEAIFELCYPMLREARATGQDVLRAVQQERDRGSADLTEPETPASELGRRAKAYLDMPTSIVNRVVSKAATQRLRAFQSKRKPS
jgi:hypothetical protein